MKTRARATLNRRRRRVLGVWQAVVAASDDAVGLKVALQGFAIDASEVTIGQFRQFVRTRELETHAERNGGGFEYAMGWERRPDWTRASPYGHPGGNFEPTVHVTWHEAKLYCEIVAGRLPRFEEWCRAAYEEMRHAPTDGLEPGRRYTYPVGDTPAGMNTSGDDQWPGHAPAGATRRGVNGLYDMGANVWAWMADRRGEEALTAGGSW